MLTTSSAEADRVTAHSRAGRATPAVLGGVLSVVAVALAAPGARADDARGVHAELDTGVRFTPEGARHLTDVGYRIPLSDDDSRLLRETYLDAGFTSNVSPAFAWAGGYAEILPVQVLKLRASASYMQYFGTFGYLFRARRTADGTFPLEELDADHPVGSGLARAGLLARVSATPRIELGGVVALAETTLGWIGMDVDGPYYEPMYDMVFEPKDTFYKTRPTVGYRIDLGAGRGWILPGVRYAHSHTFGADVTRDVLLGLLVWKPPASWWASAHPRLALAAGAWTRHPSRRGTPYVAAELTLHIGGDSGL